MTNEFAGLAQIKREGRATWDDPFGLSKGDMAMRLLRSHIESLQGHVLGGRCSTIEEYKEKCSTITAIENVIEDIREAMNEN